MSTNLEQMSVNAIRVLAADAVQKANSGHPGLPLGCAAIGYELWGNHINQIHPLRRSWFHIVIFASPTLWIRSYQRRSDEFQTA